MITILKIAKTSFITLVLGVLLVISYNFSHVMLQSYGLSEKPLTFNRVLCHSSWKWESLNFNVSRRTKLFLKLKDFFWDQHTLSLPLPYGTMGSKLILQKILATLTNSDMPGIVDSLKCRSCVVVGNGISNKNSSLGDVINKYDVVIRLNNAPVRGYEEDVGNKTTMRFFYPESASYNPIVHNQPDTLMVLVPFKQEDLSWLNWIVHNEKRVMKGFWRPPPLVWLGELNQLRILDPFFMYSTATHLLQIPIFDKTATTKNPFHPTTGILAVYVALNYCDVVHLAGFGYPRKDDPEQLIHYYGHNTMKDMVHSYHNLIHEVQALRRLEDSGAILHLRPNS
ncbi:CMP-N-acetylneuraminate-beta-galactosamide-alpha-2,3-sialyltransferase 4 isoform X2 [Arapaima gigas]